MSEAESDRSVIVTAEERPHPALRKLAQACLALAKHLHDGSTAPSTTAPEHSGSDLEAAQ